MTKQTLYYNPPPPPPGSFHIRLPLVCASFSVNKTDSPPPPPPVTSRTFDTRLRFRGPFLPLSSLDIISLVPGHGSSFPSPCSLNTVDFLSLPVCFLNTTGCIQHTHKKTIPSFVFPLHKDRPLYRNLPPPPPPPPPVSLHLKVGPSTDQSSTRGRIPWFKPSPLWPPGVSRYRRHERHSRPGPGVYETWSVPPDYSASVYRDDYYHTNSKAPAMPTHGPAYSARCGIVSAAADLQWRKSKSMVSQPRPSGVAWRGSALAEEAGGGGGGGGSAGDVVPAVHDFIHFSPPLRHSSRARPVNTVPPIGRTNNR